MWVGEVRWEALGNGGLHGGAAGGGTKHRWASKKEGFSDCGATCIKEECHTIKTHSNRPYTHTHTSYQISGEYARGCGCQACDEAQQLHHEIPMCASTDLQGCQRRVCSRTCTFTLFSSFFLHTQMYWKSQPSLQIWHIAKDIHRVCHTHACTHTYTWPFDFRVTLKEPFWFFSEISLSCLWCLITLYSKLLQEWKILDFQPLLEPVIHLSQPAWRCEKRDCAK